MAEGGASSKPHCFISMFRHKARRTGCLEILQLRVMIRPVLALKESTGVLVIDAGRRMHHSARTVRNMNKRDRERVRHSTLTESVEKNFNLNLSGKGAMYAATREVVRSIKGTAKGDGPRTHIGCIDFDLFLTYNEGSTILHRHTITSLSIFTGNI